MAPDSRNVEHSKKALVRGTISYLESQGLPVNKSAIFRHFDLSRSQGYAALNIPVSKRNDPEWEETRGRPSKISEEDQVKMERILWDERFEGASLNWKSLAREAGVDTACNQRTLHRCMGTLSYRRCLGCGRTWTADRVKERRVEHARAMLEAFPDPMAWRFVRFGGELHFGFGLDGKMRLLPRVGEKLCEGCAEAENHPALEWPRDVKRVHAWAAVGYGFKSELVFYDESTSPNSSGVMSMSTYCNEILSGVVGPWMMSSSCSLQNPPGGGIAGDPTSTTPTAAIPSSSSFILEEDADCFAQGSASKVNEAQAWKDLHGLRHHFSCGDSPDLSPLDSLWPAPGKQWEMMTEGVEAGLLPLADWEDETLRRRAREAWERVVEQERVDMWVEFMPQRLRQVVESEGRMVPW
jgi:hypothetical protein